MGDDLFDYQAVRRGKQAMRERLASLSFSEKIKILEKLRDRSLAIAASGLRRKPAGKLAARDGSSYPVESGKDQHD